MTKQELIELLVAESTKDCQQSLEELVGQVDTLPLEYCKFHTRWGQDLEKITKACNIVTKQVVPKVKRQVERLVKDNEIVKVISLTNEDRTGATFQVRLPTGEIRDAQIQWYWDFNCKDTKPSTTVRGWLYK